MKRWERYAPDIGNNRELPDGERLELEVRTRLSRDELVDWSRRVQGVVGGGDNAATVKVLEECVRLVGTHRIDDKPVTTLLEYYEIITSLLDVSHFKELLAVVTKLNTFSGDDAVFSERLSGGMASTLRRSAAKKDEKTEGR